MFFYLTLVSLIVWVTILFLPWNPWGTSEYWDVATSSPPNADLSDVTIIIPARNEADVLQQTFPQVQKQATNIIIINDNSTDQTAAIVSQMSGKNTRLIRGKKRPEGWTGKLWALEQGRKMANTPIIMLLDADIKLKPGVITGLKRKLQKTEADFISLMAKPTLQSNWQKLIMPAFIYFFKLLYPFKLSNGSSLSVAAAAGGCIITRKTVLDDIGGFASLKGALIDDCTLARRVKDNGYQTWLGLTHSVQSVRRNQSARVLLNMVARSAYAQLQYSLLWLVGCTILMLLVYLMPIIGLFSMMSWFLALPAVLILIGTFVPVITFYDLSVGWALAIPLSAVLFLVMTWISAIRYWSGERMRWRGRTVQNKI